MHHACVNLADLNADFAVILTTVLMVTLIMFQISLPHQNLPPHHCGHYLAIISQNKVSKVSKCIILPKYGYFSCHGYRPVNHPVFACIFGNTVGSFSCTRALRQSQGRVQGAIAPRSNGIMDNESSLMGGAHIPRHTS